MKKILLVFLLLSNSIFAQISSNIDTVYINQDLKEISKSTFKFECKKDINKCMHYTTDSIVVSKINTKYFLGKLDSTQSKQIRAYLKKITKINIPEEESIIINFRDSLYDYDSKLIHHKNHLKKHKNFSHKKFSYKSYKKRHEKINKSRNKCVKKYESKLPVKIFYIYNIDKGIPKLDNDIKWFKDNGVLKNIFFNVMFNYSYVLIKPNGNIFMSGGHFSDKNLKKLITDEDWSEHLIDFKKSKNNIISYGVFKLERHYPHCF